MPVIVQYIIGAVLAGLLMADPAKLRHALFWLRGRDQTGKPVRRFYI